MAVLALGAQQVLAAGWTQTTLKDFFKARWIDLGFSHVEDYTSGTDQFFVVSYLYTAGGLKNTAFIRVRVTSTFQLSFQIGDGWTSATQTLANASTLGLNSFTPTVGQDVRVRTEISGEDWRALTIRSGSGVGIGARFLVLSPPYIQSWYNEDQTLNVYIMNGLLNDATYRGPSLASVSNAYATYAINANNTFFINAPIATNDYAPGITRDVRAGLWLQCNGNTSGGRVVFGVLPDEMAAAHVQGLNVYDSFTAEDGFNYIVLQTGLFINGSNLGIVWRL